MNKRKTTNQFRQEMLQKYGNEYTVLGEYINARTHIKMRHNECGNVFNALPTNLLKKAGCMECKGRNISKAKTKSHDQFLTEFLELSKGEYELLDKYEHGRKKVRVKHNLCGHTYKVRPQDYLSGRRCPNCKYVKFGDERRKSNEMFREEVSRLTGNEYIFLEDYQTSFDKIEVKHIKCGNTYEVTPTLFLRGRRCPHCALHEKQSRGEKAIKKYLRKSNMHFKREYSFSDLRMKKKLRFDFAIFNNQKELTALIEFDGRQHHEPVEVFGGLESFKRTVYSDKLKNEYCRKNGIPLLRLTEKDLEDLSDTLEAFAQIEVTE